jgi:hypothetical protein
LLLCPKSCWKKQKQLEVVKFCVVSSQELVSVTTTTKCGNKANISILSNYGHFIHQFPLLRAGKMTTTTTTRRPAGFAAGNNNQMQQQSQYFNFCRIMAILFVNSPCRELV